MIKPLQYSLCLARMTGYDSITSYPQFMGTDLSNADLRGADLRVSDFIDVDFSSADLSYADFRGSMFVNVNLKSANLRGANLENCLMKHTNGLGHTLLRRYSSPLACALARVGAPSSVISCVWTRDGCDFGECDYWVGIAKLHMLGQDDD